jgi:hypothetical protein
MDEDIATATDPRRDGAKVERFSDPRNGSDLAARLP